MRAPENQDPIFAQSEAIKAEYLASGCQASDVDAAVSRLMAECGELFEDDRAAWSFLMEEPHEETETDQDTVSVRVAIDVTYALNGERAVDLVARLQAVLEQAMGNGLLSGETEATVDARELSITIVPEPFAEEELAQFMAERIDNGSLELTDIPNRLARYGLMDPHAFINEMRERQEISMQERSDNSSD